mgnify:CR=1 FL=1
MPRSYSRKTRSSQYPPPCMPRLFAGTYLYLETDIGHAQRNQPRSHLLLHFTGSGSTRLGEDGSLLFHLYYIKRRNALSVPRCARRRSDGGEFGGVFIRQRQKFTDSGNAVLLLERINQSSDVRSLHPDVRG